MLKLILLKTFYSVLWVTLPGLRLAKHQQVTTLSYIHSIFVIFNLIII